MTSAILAPEHLAYFRDLLEGRAVPPWHVWWPAHSHELSHLPRMQFLQLKFYKLRRAAEILNDAGIAFQWSPTARVAAVFADYDPSWLDERGLPRPELFRKAYGGIVPAFAAGDTVKGSRLVAREIKRILKGDPLVRCGELEELEFGAQHLYAAGHTVAARAILQAIAGLHHEDDLLGGAIFAARNFLAANPKGDG